MAETSITGGDKHQQQRQTTPAKTDGTAFTTKKRNATTGAAREDKGKDNSRQKEGSKRFLTGEGAKQRGTTGSPRQRSKRDTGRRTRTTTHSDKKRTRNRNASAQPGRTHSHRKTGQAAFKQEKEQDGEDRHTACHKEKSRAQGHTTRQHSYRQKEAYIRRGNAY